jgi:predicted exporter
MKPAESMEPTRQKWAARALLAAGTVLGLLWLARLDYAAKISTDVLDLIPSGERAPELALARRMASERQARVAFFALRGPDADRRERAATLFAETLRADPAFAEVRSMGDTSARDALGRQLFAQRFELLLPGWLAARKTEYAAAAPATPWPEWLAERTAAELETFMAKPEAMAFQDLVPSDPQLLLPGLVAQMPGFAETTGTAGDRTLIWARTTDAPLSDAGQGPVIAAVEKALGAARTVEPAAQLQWVSIGRFAAENRRRIESEMSMLNLISLAAVLGVAALCMRRIHQTLHLAPVVLGALLGAWVGTTMAFGRVHVLVFVVGSLLGGVAIDYGFYLYLQPPIRPGEPYLGKVRRLIKPLLASALTTVIGFSLLLFSELPLIRQLGVFVSTGLIAALAAALLWFAQIDRPFTETWAFARARLHGDHPVWRLVARVLLLAGAAVALVGPWRLHWRDDIRELEALPAAMRAETQEVRALFGETAQRTVYLTRGDSPAAARTALKHFLEWHAGQFAGAPVASLGLAVPTPDDFAALPGERARLAGYEPALRVALERHGLEAAEFEPFFTAWREWLAAPAGDYDSAVRALGGALQGPLALTMATEPGASWFVTLAEHPPGAEPPAALATVGLDQLQSLNRLFSRYRVSAVELSALGLGLVGLSVFVLYGLRRGVRIFALPSGSCLFAFGVLGLAGQTLNLFHLLGAFLGVCLSHNYAIFSAENAARGEEPPPSIRLSALTTAASFGVLALSSIPVVAALGEMVALIVMCALAAVELEPIARRSR